MHERSGFCTKYVVSFDHAKKKAAGIHPLGNVLYPMVSENRRKNERIFIMEWIKRLNESIGYIEEHLTGEIDLNQLGRIACCSSWHFQRMFTYMAGIPLSEYIRRRKMSLAAD